MVDGMNLAFVLEDQDLIAKAADLRRRLWSGQGDLGSFRAVVFGDVEHFAPCTHGLATLTWARISQLTSILAGNVREGRCLTSTEPIIPSTRAREGTEQGGHGNLFPSQRVLSTPSLHTSHKKLFVALAGRHQLCLCDVQRAEGQVNECGWLPVGCNWAPGTVT